MVGVCNPVYGRQEKKKERETRIQEALKISGLSIGHVSDICKIDSETAVAIILPQTVLPYQPSVASSKPSKVLW